MKNGFLKGFGYIKNKISTMSLFDDNIQPIKDIFYTLQSPKIKISEETYNKEYLPLNKYYKKEQHLSNPILYIGVVSFNQKKGSIIEFTYPDKKELFTNENTNKFFTSLIDKNNKNIDTIEKVFDNINNQLTYLCMPDGAHSLTSDSQFFLIQNFSKILFGISCYRQLQVTQAMKEDEQENTRECVQKAMCIISKVPFFGQMASKLSITMLAYFNQDSLKDKKIIQDLYSNYPSNYMSRINVSEILESFSLKKLIFFMKDKIFTLIKLILLEKKILVYSHVSNNICTFIFSFLSLFPAGAFFNLDNQGRAKAYYDCYTPYGLPLKFINSKSVLYSIMTLYDVEEIEKKDIVSFFIGTTNQLLLNYNKLTFDCVINLDENKIIINKEIPKSLIHLGVLENSILNKLKRHCKFLFSDVIDSNMDDNWMLDSEKDNSMSFDSKLLNNQKNFVNNSVNEEEENFEKYEGSDDYLRGIFTKFIKNFLADISLVKKIIKSKDANEKKLSDIKEVLDNYNCAFIFKWISTKNFLYWNYEHDPELWRLSPHLKKCKNAIKYYENGNIYEGDLAYGEPNDNGKLTYYIGEKKYIYEGTFKNGKKNGKGNLSSEDNKFNYDGDWKNDQFNGFGALFDSGEKYTGEFKDNKYNGKGNLFSRNGDVIEGEFFKGKIIFGEIMKENGEVYRGNFKDGIPHGKGRLTKKNGEVFNGNFFEGIKKGFGNFVDGKGNKYEGFFDKNMFNGKGVLCKKSGELLKGIFKDGEFVEKIDDLILEKEDVNNFEKVEKINDGEKVIEIKQKNDWQVAEIKIKQENENENNDVVKKETTNDLNNIEENDKKIDNIVKNNEKVKDNLNGISDIKKNEKQQ